MLALGISVNVMWAQADMYLLEWIITVDALNALMTYLQHLKI